MSIHLVPVPEEHLASVYEFLAGVMKTGPDDKVEAPDGSRWGRDELAHLKRKLSDEGKSIMLEIATASLANGTSAKVDLLQHISGRSPDRLRATLGWLSKHSRTVLGRGGWPIAAPVAGQEDSGYWMPVSLAELVKEVWADD